MRKALKVLGVVFILFVALGAAMIMEFSRTDRVISATDVDPVGIGAILASLPDGTYAGEFHPGRFVGATVAVHVQGHRINAIDIIEHNYGQGKPAESITASVILRQGLDVDVVSGATVSSKVILVAVENALRRR